MKKKSYMEKPDVLSNPILAALTFVVYISCDVSLVCQYLFGIDELKALSFVGATTSITVTLWFIVDSVRDIVEYTKEKTNEKENPGAV